MPKPDKALGEIKRALKPGGLLIGPTFIWRADAKQRICEAWMGLAEFRVLHRWDAEALASFVERQGSSPLEQHVMGGSIRLLCCLITQKL